MYARWWTFPLALLLSTVAAGLLVLVFIIVIVYPTLPSLEVLTDYQPKVPLRIYSTEGLLNENEFRKTPGLKSIAKYRKEGLIKPVGFAMVGPGVGTFYHPSQIAQLRMALGITLDNTEGLLNELQFAKASRLTQIASYRKRGLVKPVGFAMAGPGLSAFYYPRQITELKTALGITMRPA